MLYLFACLMALFAAARPGNAGDVLLERGGVDELSSVVSEYKSRLGIAEEVSVRIVETNVYLVSVHRAENASQAFVIKFDRRFLRTLSEDERRAAVAHELGHVWIFKHAPYRQTEFLANEKALLLVSKTSLENVYGKLWDHEGAKGSFQAFLASVEQSLE